MTRGQGKGTFRERIYELFDEGEEDFEVIAQRVKCPVTTVSRYRHTWLTERTIGRGDREQCGSCTIYEDYMNPITLLGDCLGCVVRKMGYISVNLAESGELLELVQLTWSLREMPEWAVEERRLLYGE